MTIVRIERHATYNVERFRRSRYATFLDEAQLDALDVVSHVLPFRVNNYVCDELIDWSQVPNDPIYQLTFPQRGMLSAAQYRMVSDAMESPDRLAGVVGQIRSDLNPHPADQVAKNVPLIDGSVLEGCQHKYASTVLVFPARGQGCHAFCSYCFRWPQFVRTEEPKFSTPDASTIADYLRQHPEVSDVVLTGGDPLSMRTNVLERFVEPLMTPEFSRLTLRVGTKAPLFQPGRVTEGPDGAALLGLFERWVDHFDHVAVMLHVSHPRELSTVGAQRAVGALVATGATLRSQAPLVAHVNDSARTWAQKIRAELSLGIVPYYMFVVRDTGAHDYFAVSIDRALHLYQQALSGLSGLAKTLRGPVLSTGPGKVRVLEVHTGGTVTLEILQSRFGLPHRSLVTADLDHSGTWVDETAIARALTLDVAADESGG